MTATVFLSVPDGLFRRRLPLLASRLTNSGAGEGRDRQVVGPGQGPRRPAQALARRARCRRLARDWEAKRLLRLASLRLMLQKTMQFHVMFRTAA